MADDPDTERIAFSLVIPAYNEARRLPTSLASVRAYLDAKQVPYEVIVVDDGSADGTAGVVADLRAGWPALRLVCEPHRGKGSAVRAGMLTARGAMVAIADADLSMPVKEFDRFEHDVVGPCDIAIGSREAPGAVRYGEPWYRHLMGRVFNALVRLLLLPGIQDTQCGFKLLRRAVAADLCRHQTIDGWGFDVELLTAARQRGYTIREVGIPWYYAPGSRVHPLRDTITMVRDVLRIWLNARRGLYAPHPGEPVPSGADAGATTSIASLPMSKR